MMVADGLAPYGARVSAVIMMTQVGRLISGVLRRQVGYINSLLCECKRLHLLIGGSR